MVAANIFFPFTADLLLSEPGHCSRKAHGHGHQRQHCAAARKILLDVRETDSSIEILADLPGVSKSDVELDIGNDALIIGVQPAAAPVAPAQDNSKACEKAVKSTEVGKQDGQPADAQSAPETSAKPEEKKPQPKVLRKERSQRFAKRALKLPETADLTRTDASLTDGVLRIVVSKKELPSPKRIRIA